jgi:predicted Zn-dependent peptidase
MNSLFTRIIERGTNTYKTARDLAKKLDEMYGAVLVCDVSKYGEMHIIDIKVQVPRSTLIKENLLKEAFELLNDVINNPLSDDTKFDEDIFNNEKNNLKSEILARQNDKLTHAIDRCLEEMCSEENYGVAQYGDVDVLEKVTNEELFTHFKNVMSTSAVDVSIIGDIDFDEVEKNIEENLTIQFTGKVDIPKEKIIFEEKEVKNIEEFHPVQQGKLVVGYRTNVPKENKMYKASLLCSLILGGGPSAKLFVNIREKNSLCYFIQSKVDKFKGVMFVVAGIELDKRDVVLSMVDEQLNDITIGNITDEEIEIAKESLTSGLRSISDFSNSYIGFYYSQLLCNDKVDVDRLIDDYKEVTKDQIVEAAKLIKKDTVYFMNGEVNK